MNRNNIDSQAGARLLPRQQGVVLLVMLALLFIATLLGIAMVTATMGETRMASLRSQREFSHTLAEAGASAVALKALNDLDPNQQALQPNTWDCTALGWQGGMGSTTTQPPGTCTIALETPGDSYSGWLRINAGTSDTMTNQLRAQAAVVPLLSGIGSIIGAPGRAGFVVAAATVSPDPGAAAIPGAAAQSSWLQRNGGWYWPVATSTAAEGQPPTSTQSSSSSTTTTQPFALKAIPTPSNLPDQPWTTYSWTDYKRGLGNDATSKLRDVAITVGVSQRYQALSEAYQQWEQTQQNYQQAQEAAMQAAQSADAMGTITQAAGAATGGAASAASSAAGAAGSSAVDQAIQEMNDAGNEYIDAAAAVIQARQAIREPWGSLAALDDAAEHGGQAVWRCGDNGTDRAYFTEKGKTDDYFRTQTAANMPVKNNGGQGGGQGGGKQGSNVQKVIDAANTLQENAEDGEDPDSIGSAITNGPLGNTSAEPEPEFMLLDGKADGLAQTNPMCNADAELIIQAQSGTSSGAGTPSAPGSGACSPGNSGGRASPNACDPGNADHDKPNQGNGGNPPGQTDTADDGTGVPTSPAGSTGSTEPVNIQQVTIVHTGPVTFKAEAPLQGNKVADILVSNGTITVASDQQDQSDPAGLVLWADGDIAINRPVSGAAVAGGTVTVDPTDQTMLTYNPAVDPILLGNGKFPLAGYALGSWTSLASTP